MRDALEECDYDVDATIATLMQTMEICDGPCGEWKERETETDRETERERHTHTHMRERQTDRDRQTK